MESAKLLTLVVEENEETLLGLVSTELVDCDNLFRHCK